MELVFIGSSNLPLSAFKQPLHVQGLFAFWRQFDSQSATVSTKSMSIPHLITTAIRKHNAEFSMRAVIGMVMGIGSSLLVYFVTTGLCFLMMMSGPWLEWASGIFIVFFAVGVYQARRGFDPLAGMTAPTATENRMAMVSRVFVGVGISPRHAVRGLVAMVLHGPTSIVHSVGLWRSRLPHLRAVVEDAASLVELLSRRDEVPWPQDDSARAAELLCAAGLAKVRTDFDAQGRPARRLRLTQRTLAELINQA